MTDQCQIKYSLNSPDVVFEEYPDETVIADLKRGYYFTLNRTAADVFGALMTAPNLATAERWLAGLYQADAAAIASAVEKFCELLEREAIVVRTAADDTGEHLPVPLTLRASDAGFGTPELVKYADVEDLLKLDPVHEVQHESGWPSASENPPA